MKDRMELLTENIPIRVSRTMRDELRKEAIKLGLKMNTYIRQILKLRNGSN